MKAEIKQLPPIVQPKEILLTLSGQEAKNLYEFAGLISEHEVESIINRSRNIRLDPHKVTKDIWQLYYTMTDKI